MIPAVSFGPPEVDFILRCVRRGAVLETSDPPSSLVRPRLDWDLTIGLASRSGVIPLVYRALRGPDSQGIPDHAWRRLEALFHQSARHSLRLAGELLDLVRLFRDREIGCVPFKGPALAHLAYGDPTGRTFNDLDLWVRSVDVIRARNVLLERGFLPRIPLAPALEEGRIRFSCDYDFHRTRDRMLVEIHWAIAPPSASIRLDEEGLWRRARSMDFLGTEIPTFAPEDLLLLLCVHGSRHAWWRLEWLCDLARLAVASPRVELDWRLALDRAEAVGCRRILLLGVHLAHALLNAPIPDAVVERARREPALVSLSRTVERNLFLRGSDQAPPKDHPFFFLRTRERLRDQARFCVLRAVSPTHEDWSRAALPRSFFFLYPLLRPLRLLAKHGRRLLSAIAAEPSTGSRRSGAGDPTEERRPDS